jgi:hypothetical protein
MDVYNLLLFTELLRSAKFPPYLPMHKREHTRKPMFPITTVLKNSKLCTSDSVSVTELFINYLYVSSGRVQRLTLRHRIKCKDLVAALLKTHVKNFRTGNEKSPRTSRV